MRGRRCEDIGYEADQEEDPSFHEDVSLEEVERLLEEKLSQYYTKLQNSNSALTTLMKQSLSELRGIISHLNVLRDQGIIRELVTSQCQEISKLRCGSPILETNQQLQ